MSVAIRAITRLQDGDDAPSLGAGQDGYALTWDNASGAFVATALSASGLAADGSVTGATSAAQAFTAGVRVGAGWSADDTAVNVKRTLSGVINSHAYRDESALTPGAGTTGYAPYDSQYTLAGATSYDHFASFQNRPTFSGSGTITKHVGFWSLPEHSGAGTITSLYHNWVWNVQGGGPVTNQYGLYVNELTGGGTNYAIFTAGSTPSFLNGNVRLGSELRVDGLAAFGNVATNSAYQLFVSSNLNATKIAAQAVIAVAPINVSTGNTYGAFYSISALNNTLAAIGTNFLYGFTARATIQATAANSALRYAYAAHVQASASANTGYTATALGMYGLLVDAFGATGAGTISLGQTAGIVINNQGTAKAPTSYGLKIESQSGSSTTYAIHTASGAVVLNDSGTDSDFRVEGDTDANLIMVDASTDRVGVGVTAPAAKLHVDQSSTTGAVPVLTVDQADVSEEFIRFIGASAADASQSVVDAADMTTPGALTGWLKIYVQDDASSGAITDGVYYVPFYAAPTA